MRHADATAAGLSAGFLIVQLGKEDSVVASSALSEDLPAVRRMTARPASHGGTKEDEHESACLFVVRTARRFDLR